jgi:hypothetical protein
VSKISLRADLTFSRFPAVSLVPLSKFCSSQVSELADGRDPWGPACRRPTTEGARPRGSGLESAFFAVNAAGAVAIGGELKEERSIFTRIILKRYEVRMLFRSRE